MSGEHRQSIPERDETPPGPQGPAPPDESDATVPEPLLLNCWKHHAGEIRTRIHAHVARGETGLRELSQQLLAVGTRITDLYVGELPPRAVAEQILDQLQHGRHFAPEAFREWVAQQAGYGMIELSDQSRWCLRWGKVAQRYVHVHPGRYSPLTIRVRASLLKTAVAAIALAEYERRDPLSLNVVNDARRRILHLGPVPAIAPGESPSVVLRTILAVPG